jgi:hypothetical protein
MNLIPKQVAYQEYPVTGGGASSADARRRRRSPDNIVEVSFQPAFREIRLRMPTPPASSSASLPSPPAPTSKLTA